MHIIVCMKQVVDLQQIRIKSQTREPVLEGLPLVFGDFDKNALEEAVRIKERASEAGEDARVTAVAVGSSRLSETIKEALAIGADEAVVLTDPAFQRSDAAGSARALAAAIRKIAPVDLILTGEGSADEYSGQVPSRLADLLDLPQITYVRELEVRDGRICAVRDLEESLVVVEAGLPALVSVAGELNKPRLPPLTAILRAGRKPIHQWTPAELGLEEAAIGAAASSIQMLGNLAPEQERKGVVYDGSADEAVANLLDDLLREGVIE
ncbi:MAG: electron transfer flavoprotein subunit beta/FixA family protein [Planctomycetota bacterium]